jgi:sortase (surface protein transpeptidase)
MALALAGAALFAGPMLGPTAHAQAPAVHMQDDPDETPPPPAPMPVQLVIPVLHIHAPIEDVGTDDDGSMGSPSTADSVAWFEPGFRPGEPGNAVIAGHVDWVDRAAVFWFVKNLSVGDEVDVVNDDGSQTAFTVDDVEQYDDVDIPMDEIFGTSDQPHLNLVTCSGVFSHVTHSYNQRTVVYTTLASVDANTPQQTSGDGQ